MKAIIAPDAARTPGVAVICVYDAPGLPARGRP